MSIVLDGTNSQIFGVPGMVLQVVQGTLAGGVSTSSSTPVDTGLSVTITPTSATSKILVMFTHPAPIKGNTNSDVTLNLVRNSTTLVAFNDVLFASGITNNYGTLIGGSFLDSPATTSATIYKTMFANGQGSGLQVYAQSSGPGSIIVMEIAA
jgi:hypothetical protein